MPRRRRPAAPAAGPLAIDYFGRTAGVEPRDGDLPFRHHVAKLEFEKVEEDVGAAAGWFELMERRA